MAENTIDQAEINARVRDVVGSLVPGGRREVTASDRLTDLGFDSLATLELAMALETEFDLTEVPEDQTVEMATVGDIETLIGSLVGTPSAA
ncbi:MAG: acyl carrier protein [Catenulispora sp.]|nr:acyl carrier protein [Catenulispora sp.]